MQNTTFVLLETMFLLITSHGSSYEGMLLMESTRFFLGFFSLYIALTLPNIPTVSFYVSMWFSGNNMEQGRGSHAIKNKYNLVHAISNLDFLSMFFFSLLWLKLRSCKKMHS